MVSKNTSKEKRGNEKDKQRWFIYIDDLIGCHDDNWCTKTSKENTTDVNSSMYINHRWWNRIRFRYEI